MGNRFRNMIGRVAGTLSSLQGKKFVWIAAAAAILLIGVSLVIWIAGVKFSAILMMIDNAVRVGRKPAKRLVDLTVEELAKRKLGSWFPGAATVEGTPKEEPKTQRSPAFSALLTVIGWLILTALYAIWQ